MATDTKNLLLDSLSSPVREQIAAKLQPVDLPVGTVLQEPGTSSRFAHFMTSGISSVVLTLQEGGTAEVSLIGSEGLVGCMALLGSQLPVAECVMQVAGSGLRIEMAELKRLFLTSEEVRTQILKFVQQQSLTTNQIAACNRLHEAEPRIIRWLLMVQDRIHRDSFSLTHEYLAQMLGTHRPTVSIVLGTLARAGLIQHSRGRITLVSREQLEAAACDCYEVTRTLLLHLYED